MSSPLSNNAVNIFDITGKSHYEIKQHLIMLQHDPKFSKFYKNISRFLDNYECDIVVGFVKFVRRHYGSQISIGKWWLIVDTFLQDYFHDSQDTYELDKNDITTTLGIMMVPSYYIEKRICYNIPPGAPFLISGIVKTKMISSDDPDIAKLGSTIPKTFIEKFLDYITPYHKTSYSEENWKFYKMTFLREYVSLLSPHHRQMFCEAYTLDALDKSLKVIAFDLL